MGSAASVTHHCCYCCQYLYIPVYVWSRYCWQNCCRNDCYRGASCCCLLLLTVNCCCYRQSHCCYYCCFVSPFVSVVSDAPVAIATTPKCCFFCFYFYFTVANGAIVALNTIRYCCKHWYSPDTNVNTTTTTTTILIIKMFTNTKSSKYSTVHKAMPGTTRDYKPWKICLKLFLGPQILVATYQCWIYIE